MTAAQRSEPALIHLARPAMGSLLEIYAAGEAAPDVEQAVYQAFDLIDLLEGQFSHFRPDSDICRINAGAYREPIPVAEPVWNLLQRLRRWSGETEGAFDCTAGRLVRLWGFFRQGQAHGERTSPPAPETLARVVQQIGWRHVELNEEARTIRLLTPELELHLGAVGKGYILQCAADALRQSGVACALLHCGHSSIIALGAPPNSAGWPIGISAPDSADKTEGPALATILLNDSSLSTSGNLAQTVTIAGRRFGHLFDPRTGFPIEGPASVSVVAPDASEGDALATAFSVQGVEWTRGYCRRHAEIGALFIDSDPDSPAACQVEAKPAWKITRIGATVP